MKQDMYEDKSKADCLPGLQRGGGGGVLAPLTQLQLHRVNGFAMTVEGGTVEQQQ